METTQTPDSTLETRLHDLDRGVAQLEATLDQKYSYIPFARFGLGSLQLITSLACLIIVSIPLVLTLGCCKDVRRVWTFLGKHTALGAWNVLLTLPFGGIIGFPLDGIKVKLISEITNVSDYAPEVEKLSEFLNYLKELKSFFNPERLELNSDSPHVMQPYIKQIESSITEIEKILNLCHQWADAAATNRGILNEVLEELYKFLTCKNAELTNPQELSIKKELEKRLQNFHELFVPCHLVCIQQLEQYADHLNPLYLPNTALNQLRSLVALHELFYAELQTKGDDNQPVYRDAPLLLAIFRERTVKIFLKIVSNSLEKKEKIKPSSNDPLQKEMTEILEKIKTKLRSSRCASSNDEPPFLYKRDFAALA